MKLRLLFLLSAASLLACAADNGKFEGTYENADGKALIEFLAGGKAYFSFHGLTMDCRYKKTGAKIALTCEDETTNFTQESDGALTGPRESFVARMKKKK